MLISAGEDMEAKGVTEYMWDIVYVTWGVLGLVGVAGEWGWWVWVCFFSFLLPLGKKYSPMQWLMVRYRRLSSPCTRFTWPSECIVV